jgi:serine/threonine protein kinase
LDKSLTKIRNEPESNFLNANLRYEWSIELFDALAFMHSKGVYHRDLKPCNIYLFRNRRKHDRFSLKLGDFGQSKVKSHSDMKTLVGTYYYQSPQIMDDEAYSEKTDVWYKFGKNSIFY